MSNSKLSASSMVESVYEFINGNVCVLLAVNHGEHQAPSCFITLTVAGDIAMSCRLNPLQALYLDWQRLLSVDTSAEVRDDDDNTIICVRILDGKPCYCITPSTSGNILTTMEILIPVEKLLGPLTSAIASISRFGCVFAEPDYLVDPDAVPATGAEPEND